MSVKPADTAMRRMRVFNYLKDGPFVSPDQPEPDGFVMVGWDQNVRFPAYRVAQANGAPELVPFTPLAQVPPPDYAGDWRVEAFTDAAIKQRWRETANDPALRERILARVANMEIPHQFRATGKLDPRGLIDPHAEVDLRAIRRPAFFAAPPWREPIAELDGRTSVVEFEAPREPYEIRHMGLSDPIRIRGWHIRGDGVPDGAGGRIKALAVLTGGRSIETTAIHHPDDPACLWEAETSSWAPTSYPDENGRTEAFGARAWRTYLKAFVDAGFDVLTLDKRGHGVSGGATDSNGAEQGEDIFRALAALETGETLRLLTPLGELKEGAATAGLLLEGASARAIPLMLGGASQGCMVTCWAMHKNFVGACDFDRPNPRTHGPLGFNIKAALLIAPFGGGLGYRTPDDALVEAIRREELNVQMFPSGEVLAGVSRWPALFVGRGLWDFSESLEGSLDCFRRAQGPRMIVAVRGPHGEGEWGAENIRYMQDRMAEFARSALLGEAPAGYVEPASIRDIVARAPTKWAEAAKPAS